MTVHESRRMSEADRAGLAARSPEGHAAKSMHIRGREEEWIQIQASTFRNWINVNLKEVGMQVEDLATDFSDGVKLVTLVELLQRRKLRHNRTPQSQPHALENITIALDAIKEDGIKLVNIGNTDIQNGNVKLILGLIWSLIAHYQLGASNFPPKKLMLAWLKAVLPDCNIKNFTSDWNNGIALSALIEHCRPGLLPNWSRLSPGSGLENCTRAMKIAEREFNIPMVLEPEHFASPHLDELSGMTYLSYFLKEEDSPGYYSTLNWVKNQIPNLRINNFRTDWNDGLAAAALVKSKGGSVPGLRDFSTQPEHWVNNLDKAVRGGQKLGVNPVLESKDIANPSVEYLGVMAWAAQFQWIPDQNTPADLVEMRLGANKCKVGDTCEFVIDLDKTQVSADQLDAKVTGPSGPVSLDFDPRNGRGHFTPEELGMHEVLLTADGEAVRGSPSHVRSMPNSKKDYDGIEPCAVGSTVEVLINPHHAARPDLLEVTAYSPTNKPLGCPVSDDNGTFYASFQPDEAGEWRIHVMYDGEDIENSPFKCMVFDPRAIFIPDQESARRARPGEPFTFTVDASRTGWGEVAIDVVFDNKSIRRTFYVEEIRNRVYQVTFTPQARGKHRVYIYLNGMEVKGSPFSLRIGKDIKETRASKTEAFKVDRKYKKFEEQKEERRSHQNLVEKEVFIEKPVAPPRSKREKRQTFKDFREDSQQTRLFASDHKTEEGTDLLPVNRTIAFDCPHDGADKNEIHVTITGPRGQKCPTQININQDGSGTFTCEFSTSMVGEHKIEIIIQNDQLNVTPSFYTYDASKIKVGQLPTGYIGLPVEFDIDGTGAGFGNLEIIVNGGRVTSHVHTISKEQFQANFIPHDPGRHRVDVKFNGEKVPNSPWFVEVKDPNTPLMSPMLVANPAKAKEVGDTNGSNNGLNGSYDNLPKLTPSFDTLPKPSKLSNNNSLLNTALNNRLSSSQSKLNSEFKQTSMFQSSSINQSSLSKEIVTNSSSKFESKYSTLPAKSSTQQQSSLKSSTNKLSDYEKSDFGTFSLLETPKLLTGGGNKAEDSGGGGGGGSGSFSKFQSSSVEQLNSLSNSYSPRATYSTTIERSVNTGKKNGLGGESGGKSFGRDGGLMNGGSNTMPKASSNLSKSLERSSLHTRLKDNSEKENKTPDTNGFKSSYNSLSKTERSSSAGFTSSKQTSETVASFSSTYKSSSTSNGGIKSSSIPTPTGGSSTPKLASYKGTAEKCKFVGDTVRHFNAGKVATFELFAPGTKKSDISVNIISPEKRHIPSKVVDSGNGVFRIEFTTVEVGSYAIDVNVGGLSVPNSPLIAKAYDASLIKVTDITDGVVGELSTFRVDASKAGEGQLEISINDGDVPNAVQVLGGGKCLVTFTPEQAITHEIEVMFNNDQVPGSPFLTRIRDEDDASFGGSSGGSFARVLVELEHLGLVAVGQPAEFTIRVPEGADAELAVSVQGPVEDIPVKVTGNVKNGFIAQFIPNAVGLHVVLVEYNGVAVGGTPFYSKAYDSEAVGVSDIPKGHVGKTVTFAGSSRY